MGSPLRVRYGIIWPCGFDRVVTWQLPHRRYSFPLLHLSLNPPCFTPLLRSNFVCPPSPPSSAPAVITGEVSHCVSTANCRDVTGGFLAGNFCISFCPENRHNISISSIRGGGYPLKVDGMWLTLPVQIF